MSPPNLTPCAHKPLTLSLPPCADSSHSASDRPAAQPVRQERAVPLPGARIRRAGSCLHTALSNYVMTPVLIGRDFVSAPGMRVRRAGMQTITMVFCWQGFCMPMQATPTLHRLRSLT